MKKQLLQTLFGAAVLSSAMAQAASWTPERPVEFVASAGAGGGTDTFARAIQAAINKDELMTQPIVVVNRGGGSGAEAYIQAKGNKGDPYKLYFGTQESYVLPIASKLSYSVDDLQPLAVMVFDPFLLWVSADNTGITDIPSFKQRVAAGGMKFGGARAREADHTLVSLIEQATNSKVIYLPFRSGSEAAVQLAGGHIDAHVNNPIESLEHWRAGKQQPLCVFSDQRMPDVRPVAGDTAWADIPTCKEAGLEVSNFVQPRMVWGAAGMPDDAVAYYVDLFTRVGESPEWKSYVERAALVDQLTTGEELEQFIAADKAKYLDIYQKNGWAKP